MRSDGWLVVLAPLSKVSGTQRYAAVAT